MSQYEETEQLAVDEKRKRLHYERIRIAEDLEEVKAGKVECEKQESQIEDKVYNDTKEV